MYPFGVTFYPDQWPEESWDNQLAQIRAAGFNLIRFGEMAWDWMEPSPGKFNFKELDRALNLCDKHGLKVLLGIPTSQVPPWFHRKFPGNQPVAQDGTLYPEAGPRPNICKDNTNYRRLALRLAKMIVARYCKHPAMLMWQIDNEPVYPPLDSTTSNDYCHCPHSRQAFIAWAKKRYGTIKNLNEKWGTKFWTNTYCSWDELQTPKAGIWDAGNPHIFLDWFRFKSDSLSGWLQELATTVRSLDKKHPVGTNGFIGICTRVPDHSLLSAGLDWYGLDIYPKGNKMSPLEYEYTLDLWKSFLRGKKTEFHITELQGGQNVRWGNPAYVSGKDLTDWTNTAWQRGVKALLFHAWRPPLFGSETGGFGILKSDGSSTERLEAIKKLAKKLPTFVPTTKPNEIAVAYLRGSEVQTYQEQGPSRGVAGQWEAVRSDIGLMYSIFSTQGAYQLARTKYPAADFIFDQDLESGDLPYKVIILPNPYLLSDRQYRNLKKWVLSGGSLITEARFGLKNELGHLRPTPLIEDLLNIGYDHGEVTSDGFLDVLSSRPKKEQLLSKKLGRGKIVYANYSLFLKIKNGDRKLLLRIRSSL